MGTAFTTTTALPGSGSTRAHALMAEAGTSPDTSSGTIVWCAQDTGVDDPAVRTEAAAMPDELAVLPGTGPSADCPGRRTAPR